MEDRTAVGRIVATVDVQNVAGPRRLKKIDALADPRRRAVDGGLKTGVSGGPSQPGQAGSFQGS